MLDLYFLGDTGFLDGLSVGGDRLRHLCHFAIGEKFDFMRIVRRLVIGLGIFFDVGVDVGKNLAHVVTGDSSSERGHRNLEIREGFFRSFRGALLMPAEQLVDVQPRQQQLLQGFAGQNHGVGIAGLCYRHGLQLFDFAPRLEAKGIENFPAQLVLFLLQHNQLFEALAVILELFAKLHHSVVALGILDFIETSLDACSEHLLPLAGFSDQIFVAGH